MHATKTDGYIPHHPFHIIACFTLQPVMKKATCGLLQGLNHVRKPKFDDPRMEHALTDFLQSSKSMSRNRNLLENHKPVDGSMEEVMSQKYGSVSEEKRQPLRTYGEFPQASSSNTEHKGDAWLGFLVPMFCMLKQLRLSL